MHTHPSFFSALPPSLHGHSPLYFEKLAGAIVFGFLILTALALIPNKYRKGTIALATFLAGLYYVAEFFIPIPKGQDSNSLTPFLSPVGDVSNVIGAFSVGLGIISLIGMHLRTLTRGRDGWGFSLTLVAAFTGTFVFHLLNQYAPTTVLVRHHAHFNATITNADFYNFLFTSGLLNLDSAMFALIGFFIVSASYRAFRIRSVEASLLMISALIVMLGQVSLGVWLTHWLPLSGEAANFRFEVMAQNILMYLNSPAQRAIAFGIALGFLATSLRLWLSLERGLYFD